MSDWYGPVVDALAAGRGVLIPIAQITPPARVAARPAPTAARSPSRGRAVSTTVDTASYAYEEARPEPQFKAACMEAFAIASRELNVRNAARVGFCQDARGSGRTLFTMASEITGLTNLAERQIWVYAPGRSLEQGVKTTAHETAHFYYSTWRGLSRSSEELAASRYAERFWERHGEGILAHVRAWVRP